VPKPDISRAISGRAHTPGRAELHAQRASGLPARPREEAAFYAPRWTALQGRAGLPRLPHVSLWARLRELDEWADRGLSARGLPGIVPKPRAARIVGSTRGWGCLGRGPQLLLRVSGTGAVLVSLYVYAGLVMLACLATWGWVRIVEGPGHSLGVPLVLCFLGSIGLGFIVERFGHDYVNESKPPR